jgi:hypothetical protein
MPKNSPKKAMWLAPRSRSVSTAPLARTPPVKATNAIVNNRSPEANFKNMSNPSARFNTPMAANLASGFGERPPQTSA